MEVTVFIVGEEELPIAFTQSILVFGGGDAGVSHRLTIGKGCSLMYVCTVLTYIEKQKEGL
jgi:hypothetical protein